MPANSQREQEHRGGRTPGPAAPRRSKGNHRDAPDIASNPKVPKAEREAGRERADALERHLNRLARRKKSEGKL